MTDTDISPESVERLRTSMRIGHSSTVDADRMIRTLSAALTQSRAETAAAYERAAQEANRIENSHLAANIRTLATPDQSSALAAVIADAKAEALSGPWEDKPDALTDAVYAAHPVFTKDYRTYTDALELVSNRHGKGALVGLVNYLMAQNKAAEAGRIHRWR